MVANAGDLDVVGMEVDDADNEVRTVRLINPDNEDNLSGKTLTMLENREQAGARGRDRTLDRDRNDRGRGGRGMARRGGRGRYMDN